uniref:Uncharacterized protein n=1 Tax=Oryza glaberrima TaxID=4538 RepID=I1Q0E9_ORYGL
MAVVGAAASSFCVLRKKKGIAMVPMTVATPTGTVASGFLWAKARRPCSGASRMPTAMQGTRRKQTAKRARSMVPRAGAVTAAMTKTAMRMSTRGLLPAQASNSRSASGPPSAPAPMAMTMVYRTIPAMGSQQTLSLAVLPAASRRPLI